MSTGIEIGSYNLKVVRTVKKGTKLYLTGLSKVRWNFGEEDKDTRIGIEHSLRRVLSNFDFRIYEGSIFGVSGRDVNLRIALLPPVKTEIKKMVEYEVLQFVGKGATDLSFDYIPVNIKRDYEEVPVFISMARGNFISELMDISAKCGITVKDITPNAIGLFLTYLYNEADSFTGRALIWDIGHNNMEVVVAESKQLLFARNLSASGGKIFTDAIIRMRQGNIDFDKAEEIKLSLGNFYRKDGKQTDAIEDTKLGLQNVASQFIQIYNSTLQFIRNQLKLPDIDIDRIYLCGGCGAMKGLDEFLRDSLKKDVYILDPFKKVNMRYVKGSLNIQDSTQSCEFASCFGLSLINETLTSVKPVSLLPENVKEKRSRLKRWSFAIAGIIIILLSTLFSLSKNIASAIILKKENSELQNKKETLEKQVEKLQNASIDLQDVLSEKDNYTKEFADSKLILDLFNILSNPEKSVIPKAPFTNEDAIIIMSISLYPETKRVEIDGGERKFVTKMVANIKGKYLETGASALNVATEFEKKIKEIKFVDSIKQKGEPAVEFDVDIFFK